MAASARLPLLLLGLLTGLVSAQDFDADLPFGKAVSVEDVKMEVKAQGKPGIVFVTQPWCGACKSLKQSVNKSDKLRRLMEKFVVAHATEDDGKQWQAPGKDDGYIPRVYFLSPEGEMLDKKGPNQQYAHFFSSAEAVETAMNEILKSHGKAEGEL
mmetsp:Transcript_120254/g.374453  ORF Transcript_120254/g.374453 Transcript_120254/m.374453 type:complete len:156 (+) Transcript_120254:71-538(+)